MLACYLVMFQVILHVIIYYTFHMITMETISNHLVKSIHIVHTSLTHIVYILVFIYTCPGYSCSVKERMLYSSCKGPVTDVCEQQFEITIAKKVLMLCRLADINDSAYKPIDVCGW